MKKLAVIISPNWKDYAARYLKECVDSLRTQSFQEFKIYLVDNETSEESFSFLTNLVPEATIIRLEKNEGFAGGNNAAIRESLKEDFEYILLINMDTVSEANCLERLVRTMEVEYINSTGNVTHFLGFGYCDDYNKKFSESTRRREIAYPSGAGVILRASALAKVGLFDEEMWMYNEDQDLGWRLWLAGYRCVLEPDAVIFHKYEFSRSIAKYYWMDRNRIIAMLKNYHILTLLLILPAFIIMELGLILFSLKSGWFKDKIKVWKYFFSIKNWSYIIKARHASQSLRKAGDREITALFSGRIWYQEIDDVKLRLINPVFELYWRLTRLVMFW